MEVNTIHTGDSREVLSGFEADCVDSVVTDPPYGFGKEPNASEVMRDWCEKGFHQVKCKGGFMGKEWDAFVPQPVLWKEVYRVLKPGGHMLVACGTRTEDWMAMSLRFAGFEIRDVICWHYGSGFPKSMDISKQIDKAAGAERVIVGTRTTGIGTGKGSTPIMGDGNRDITAPATEAAKQWQGWGTALKPATEFFILARKPLAESTVAENVLKHGTGGINIDGSRISLNGEQPPAGSAKRVYQSNGFAEEKVYGENKETSALGRFPANLILDDFMADELDKQSGILKPGAFPKKANETENTCMLGKNYAREREVRINTEGGGTSRFFYVAKADGTERGKHNNHPTVKPVELMQYLVKLITPPEGVVLDPFAGSGSTLIAAAKLGFKYIGIELNPSYVAIAEKRLQKELGMFYKV